MSTATPKLDALADHLADALVDRVADRLAELIAERDQAAGLVDAAEVARRFNVDRGWVYENAARLGAIRLGDGERPRLRFDPERVYEALAARPAPTTLPKPARRRARPKTAQLLPIKSSPGLSPRGSVVPPEPAERRAATASPADASAAELQPVKATRKRI